MDEFIYHFMPITGGVKVAHDDSIEVNEFFLRSKVVWEHGSGAEDDIRDRSRASTPIRITCSSRREGCNLRSSTKLEAIVLQL